MHLAARPQVENHSAKPGRCCFPSSFPLSSTVSTSSPTRTSASQSSAAPIRIQHPAVRRPSASRLVGQVEGGTVPGMGWLTIGGLCVRDVESSTGIRSLGLSTIDQVRKARGWLASVLNVCGKPLIFLTCSLVVHESASLSTASANHARNHRPGDRRTPHWGYERSHPSLSPQDRSRTP